MKKKIAVLAIAFMLLLPGISSLAAPNQEITYDWHTNAEQQLVPQANGATLQVQESESFRVWYQINGVGVVEIDGITKTINNAGHANYYYYNNTYTPGGEVSTLKVIDKGSLSIRNVQKRYESGKSTQNNQPGTGDYDWTITNIVFSTGEKFYSPISSLTGTETHNSISLSWENPINETFEGTEIRMNGEILHLVAATENKITLSELTPESVYAFELLAKHGPENYAAAETITITTKAPPIPEEVIKLTANPKHDRVDLAWQLPESEELQHVNIYRDTIPEVSFFDKVTGTITAQAAETKIFETNGTYFNDLTVEPETEYEYTVSTTSVYGVESEGVTTTVMTDEAPPPVLEGGSYTKDPATGDFIYSWESPTEGQVKVMIDGVDYKTVAAADKKIVIPAADMKYSSFGDPLITVQPIGTDGKVGEITGPATAVEEIEYPFTVTDFIKVSMGLLGLIGIFILLVLAFKLTPKWISLVRQSIQDKKDGNPETGRVGRSFSEGQQARERERLQRTDRTPINTASPRIPRESSVKQREPRTTIERQPREPRTGRGAG